MLTLVLFLNPKQGFMIDNVIDSVLGAYHMCRAYRVTDITRRYMKYVH